MTKAKGKTAPKAKQPKSKIILSSSPESAERRKREFAERWLVNGNNASEAAVFVGYSSNGASVTGCKLLADPLVQSIVGPRKTAVLEAAQLTTERWAKEMAAIGFLDPGRMYGEDGKILPLHKMPEDVRRALARVETETDKDGNVHTRAVPHDKNTALANIGRHLGVFDKDNKQRLQPIQIAIQLVG